MSKLATSSSKTTTTKKTVKKTVETPVETPVVTETLSTEPVTEGGLDTVTETVTLKQRFELLVKSKQDMIVSLKEEIQELRKMQREHDLAVKEASKKSKKKTRTDGTPRKPSGFASPVLVSDDLYGFLEQYGVKSGEPVARTDVTRYITGYIKQHDLQNPEHRREIIPDAVLSKLFGPALELKDPTDEKSPKVYTYLKLQKYLSKHFPSKATPTSTATLGATA